MKTFDLLADGLRLNACHTGSWNKLTHTVMISMGAIYYNFYQLHYYFNVVVVAFFRLNAFRFYCCIFLHCHNTIYHNFIQLRGSLRKHSFEWMNEWKNPAIDFNLLLLFSSWLNAKDGFSLKPLFSMIHFLCPFR
jgi:hypothetical protein